MADYYKSLNLEKIRNSLQQPKEEFHCNENISEIRVPRRQSGGGPGYSSSEMEDEKSSGDDAYVDTSI
jgi:hypothetical protein